jgi:hypothetical protein
MFNLWRNWIDASLFAAEAQCVVALRMTQFASGEPNSAAESRRMVSEKFAALSEAQLAAASSFLQGNSPAEVMRSALAPIKRRVQKNRRRLSRVRSMG